MNKQDKEMFKLSKLCEHWASHNETHMENFEKWRNIAHQKQLITIEDNLKNAIEMMKDCNNYLIAAKKELDKLL
ncbi:MAG: hypothetical protein ACFFBH_08600 [Promethearchaeota archaeon]